MGGFRISMPNPTRITPHLDLAAGAIKQTSTSSPASFSDGRTEFGFAPGIGADIKVMRHFGVSIDANFGPSPAEYGELKYAPDKSGEKEKRPAVRIDFKKPERYISIAKGKYSIYQPLTNQAYTGPTSSVKGQTQGGAGMLSFMSMNSGELKKNYKFEYLGEATVKNSKNELTWHLRLTPLIPAKYKYAEIWVTKDGLPVQTMIVAINKDSTTMLMTSHNDRATINLDTIPIIIPRTANIHVEK